MCVKAGELNRVRQPVGVFTLPPLEPDTNRCSYLHGKLSFGCVTAAYRVAMPSPATLLVFSGAALTLLLIPGPAVLYIVAHSARHGRRAGLVSVAGIHTGTAVHIAAALVGLSALIVASATAFTMVKLAGAAYLMWMGVRTLTAVRPAESLAPNTRDESEQSPISRHSDLRLIYRDAMIVNILNPKTAVFFLAFVPQFIDPTAGHAAIQLLALSTWFVGLGLLSDGAYALAAAWFKARTEERTIGPNAGRRGRIAVGVTYIGLGAVTALTGNAAN